MGAGDQLLIGADLMKEAETMRVACADALGVTAAFNRNLLVRMNRELCGAGGLRCMQHWLEGDARFLSALYEAV